MFILNSKKTENILVNYKLTDGEVTDFEFRLGDWGTAGENRKFFGGTPGHVSKRMYYDKYKDAFSIGRLAMDLFVSKTGTVRKYCKLSVSR